MYLQNEMDVVKPVFGLVGSGMDVLDQLSSVTDMPHNNVEVQC